MSFKIGASLAALAFLVLSGPAWADAWGAIAIDVTQATADPSWGLGGGETESEASDNATKFCQETGTKAGCKIVVTYQACGAFASDGHDAGWSKAPTKKEAEINALASCGKKTCKLVTSDCN